MKFTAKSTEGLKLPPGKTDLVVFDDTSASRGSSPADVHLEPGEPEIHERLSIRLTMHRGRRSVNTEGL
jgi:hypothetical protein